MGFQLASSKSGSPTITLQYRASISQSTGEDWKGIALTLSTASPLVGSEIPKLEPWTIGTYRLPPPQTIASPVSEYYAFMDISEEAPVETQQVTFKSKGFVAKANEGAVSSSFEVEGNSNIPSDGSSHKVSIVVSLA